MTLLTQLGEQYAGQPVAVRFGPTGCHVYLRHNHTARHLATAATLAAALSTP